MAASAATGAALAWRPIFRVPAARGSSTCAPPPGFPSGIDLYQHAYENWAGDIKVDSVWTCEPRNAEDVVTLANWAANSRYRLRPRGKAHNWSPLTIPQGTTCGEPVVLVDTTQHLTSMSLESTSPAAVRVETGATMEALLTYLEDHGYGMTATPAPGDVTVGGVLAIDGHGNAVPAQGERLAAGHTYGSVSNLVTSVTAVVWDARSGRYVLRTFERDEPDAKAFLVHLGRAFLTEVTLRVGANDKLRCLSVVDISADELFAASARDGRTFSSFADASGRVGTLWFVFTENPWLKVYSVAPTKPLTSREVTSPYNYPFSDNIPPQVNMLADRIITGETFLTPEFGKAEAAGTLAGLTATASFDLWGPSKDLLLYVKPSTIRLAATSYVVLTQRANIQRVVHEYAMFYRQLLANYQARGRYPINGPTEFRVTGLDEPADVGAVAAPALSAVRPRPDRPDWDVGIWLDTTTFPDTPGATAFHRELEQWVFANYRRYGLVRPEWSKGWAYSTSGAWSDSTVLRKTIPDTFRRGYHGDDNWDWAVRTLNAYDPHKVFTNPLLEALFG